MPACRNPGTATSATRHREGRARSRLRHRTSAQGRPTRSPRTSPSPNRKLRARREAHRVRGWECPGGVCAHLFEAARAMPLMKNPTRGACRCRRCRRTPGRGRRVVDRQPVVDGAARRVDVDRDVLVRIIGLQVQQFGDSEVRDLVVDRRAEEDDPLAQKPRVDIELALTERRLLDHHRDQRARSVSLLPETVAEPRRASY